MLSSKSEEHGGALYCYGRREMSGTFIHFGPFVVKARPSVGTRLIGTYFNH